MGFLKLTNLKDIDRPFKDLTNEREKLASYAHNAWSLWMKYMFSKSKINESGEVVIPKTLVDRWNRQYSTKYEDLPESEKESDRHEADNILRILNETT